MILNLFKRRKKAEAAVVTATAAPEAPRDYINEAALNTYRSPTPHQEQLLPCEHSALEAPYCDVDKKYQRINPIFLSWVKVVDKIPVPVFAVFNPFKSPGVCDIGLRSWSLTNTHFTLRSDVFGHTSISEAKDVRTAHPLLAPYCSWAYEWEKNKKGESVSLECCFTGLIPDATRRKIGTAKHEFDSVAIVAEADWKVQALPNPDPLVIGVKGRTCWLIDKFDLTSAERIAASEFSYGMGI